MSISLEHISKSHLPQKKFDAHLKVGDDKKVIPFGQKGYKDYTQTKDPKRKDLYLLRHQSSEDWSDPLTPGFWSRWYLWNKPTRESSEKHLRVKFGL